ncbi:MAG: hypothetical protein EXS08_06670 [Planctomycetes bacterium]|nr:hypothetical protein [Planctomycetota bacterium]
MTESRTPSRTPATISACRAEARRLLDHLRGVDPERVRAAAERFARLRSFATAVAGLLSARERVRLKHALAVVAEENGASSWPELKRRLEARAASAALPPFHAPRLESLLNRWFTSHAEARASLQELGGYLLPFREQCFVTEAEGIRALGLEPEDPDWKAIGFDLVRPLDAAAHARLCAKRRAALAQGIGVPREPRRSA